MKRNLLKLKLYASLAIFISANSYACGWDGCIFASVSGGNTPQVIKVVVETAKANIDSSLQIVKSFSQNDVQNVYRQIGKFVVEGECIGCKQAISSVAGQAGVDTVEQMVGRGFIILTDTNSMFITYDSTAKAPLITKTEAPPQPITTIKKVPKIVEYESSPAMCIVTNEKLVTIGYEDFPKLKKIKTGEDVLLKKLKKGDLVTVTAPICKEENKPDNHQKSLTKVQVKFTYDSLPPRVGQEMVYLLHGTPIE